MKDLHENFILLHNFEHDNAPIKQWVLEDETYTGQYHLSWDVLMPLVEKIGNLKFHEHEGLEKYLELNFNEDQVHIFSTLEEVYKPVVEFVKWYNLNLQK